MAEEEVVREQAESECLHAAESREEGSTGREKPRLVVLRKSPENFLRNLLQPGGEEAAPFQTRIRVDPNVEAEAPVLARAAHRVWTDDDTGASIYLGPRRSALVPLKELQEAGVTAIVNCSKRVPCLHRPVLHYCQVAINDVDAADILSYLPGATLFLHSYLSQGQSVLVHCEAGVSRSSTVVVAYLMRYRGMCREDAYRHVQARRSIVKPNTGFWYQLELFAKNLSNAGANSAAPPSLTRTATVDAKWAKASSAVYATCRDVQESSTEDDATKQNLIKECFDALRQPGLDLEQVLCVALDFLWGRGVLAIEVEWLVHVCRTLDERTTATSLSAPVTPSAAQVALQLLTDESSPFCEQWAGEMYPELVESVQKALRVD
jgi:hypothetical protein